MVTYQNKLGPSEPVTLLIRDAMMVSVDEL